MRIRNPAFHLSLGRHLSNMEGDFYNLLRELLVLTFFLLERVHRGADLLAVFPGRCGGQDAQED
jgi:hypothetical protein